MPNFLKSLLVGAGALMLVAAGEPAQARDSQSHVMTVTLPGGGVAEITYTGDVPPQLVLTPSDGFVAGTMPVFGLPEIGMAPSFAALEQLTATMQRQADAMFREISALPAFPEVGARLPAGVHMYSVETTITRNGTCTRRTETSYDGAAPKQVSNISGDCGQAPQLLNTPAEPHDRPGLIQAKAQPNYRNLVKPAFWQNQ